MPTGVARFGMTMARATSAFAIWRKSFKLCIEERLGAERIYKRGIGDDSQDIVEDFEKWRAGGLMEKLKEAVDEVKKEGPQLGIPTAVVLRPPAPKTAKKEVKELRQLRNLDDGLSTMEATGRLQKYTTAGAVASLWGTRAPRMDVAAMLQLFGLAEADLSRQLTFKAAEGFRVKKPFPTPCSLGDALFLYCDLARAPNKKM
eukprot:Skav203507  [mRNA]  locus=scaffold2089:216055:219176:- [translate_table: standard]